LTLSFVLNEPATSKWSSPERLGTVPLGMRTVIGACHHDCPDSCGWVVTVDDTPTGPVAVKLRGRPEHPFSQGELCPKVNRYLERVYSPDRILSPLRRIGPKGSAEFEPISWNDALDEISSRWTELIRAHTGEAIVPFFDAGNQSVLAMGAHERLVRRLGLTRLVDSVCGLAAGVGTALTYGTKKAADPVELVHAKCVVIWGSNPKLTNRHLWPFVEQARAAGATIINIDPLRTLTSDASDLNLQPLPGTDVALMLGLIHQWIANNHIDHDYVTQFAEGFEALTVEASLWPPERAASVCGLRVEDVVNLAQVIATNAPAHFRTVIGAEHREQGGTFFQVLAALPVLLGSWRHRGGGMSRSVGTYTAEALGTLDLPERTTTANGTPRSLSMNLLGRWLNEVEGTPVKSLLIWNANPLVTIPNAEAIRRGLEREDLFTVVHEQFMTDTARYADIILPATTHLESVDVVPSWGSLHLNWNTAAIPPVGESVSNSELFRRLAAAMGFADDEDLQASDDELLDRVFVSDSPLLTGISRERLEKEHTIRLSVPEDFRPYAHGGFATKSGKAVLAGPNGAPTYIAAVEGPHGSAAAEFPLSLMTPKIHTRFLNSSYAHLPNHGGREGGPYVELSASDAAARGITDGETVEVLNDRATLQLPARIGTTVRPGVVSVPFGWIGSTHIDGKTANALTSDTITNVGVGVAYSDTMVEVRKLL
jgi:anaerobic selenocysteine-containing dehydrogenase